MASAHTKTLQKEPASLAKEQFAIGHLNRCSLCLKRYLGITEGFQYGSHCLDCLDAVIIAGKLKDWSAYTAQWNTDVYADIMQTYAFSFPSEVKQQMYSCTYLF